MKISWSDAVKIALVGGVVTALASWLLERFGVGDIRHALAVGAGIGCAQLMQQRLRI